MRGWEAAAAHAKKAVPEDFWPRMFSVESGMTLLFPCKHGKVDMTKVLGEHMPWMCFSAPFELPCMRPVSVPPYTLFFLCKSLSRCGVKDLLQPVY